MPRKPNTQKALGYIEFVEGREDEISETWDWALDQLATHGSLTDGGCRRLAALCIEPKIVEAVSRRILAR